MFFILGERRSEEDWAKKIPTKTGNFFLKKSCILKQKRKYIVFSFMKKNDK